MRTEERGPREGGVDQGEPEENLSILPPSRQWKRASKIQVDTERGIGLRTPERSNVKKGGDGDRQKKKKIKKKNPPGGASAGERSSLYHEYLNQPKREGGHYIPKGSTISEGRGPSVKEIKAWRGGP